MCKQVGILDLCQTLEEVLIYTPVAQGKEGGDLSGFLSMNVFLCVLWQTWHCGENGQWKGKEQEFHVQTDYLGELHPVGVAVWLALNFMYKSKLWKLMCHKLLIKGKSNFIWVQ